MGNALESRRRSGASHCPTWEPAGRVSGGLEAARSKGVLGFDGIKMHRILINCVHSYLPCDPMPMQLGRQGV